MSNAKTFRPTVSVLEGRISLSTSPSPVLSPPLVDSPPISLGDQAVLNLQFSDRETAIVALPSGITTYPAIMIAIYGPDGPEDYEGLTPTNTFLSMTPVSTLS